MKTNNILVFLAAFSQLCCNAQKQETSTAKALLLKKTIEADITPYKQDVYSVKLREGEFASIKVNQINVGIDVLIHDPSDSLLQIVDENGYGQNEIVNIDAQKTGNYKLTVIWNFNKPLSGQYSITLARIEKAGGSIVQKAQQLFDSWYEKNAPGAAVAVVKDNQVVFKQTKGLANVEEYIPLTSSSVFEMASCSKQFTGLAVAMLVDRNKISLDDDIRRYLPEMPDYGTKITIANLVYHTSGIRSTDILEMAGYSWEDILILPMVVKFATSQKQLKFKPGDRFDYSNTNYNLLAEIVARATKQSFSAWTKENIFRPLGMDATFFKESPGDIYAHKVLCYKPFKKGFMQRPNNFAATGSAGLCTSLDDLIKWVNSFDSKQLITKDMETLLTTAGSLNDGSKVQYAFGNFIGPQGVEHLGLVIGYRTAIARFHDPKFSIIYMSNDDNDGTYQHFYQLKNMFLGVPESRPDPKSIPGVEETVKKLEAKDAPGKDSELLEFAGVYFSDELYTGLKVDVKSGRLAISHPRMSDIFLSRISDDNFGVIQFVRNENKKIVSLKLSGDNGTFLKQ